MAVKNKYSWLVIPVAVLVVTSGPLNGGESSPLPDIVKRLDRLEYDGGKVSRTGENINRLRDLQSQLEVLYWKSGDGDRVLTSLQIARIHRLRGNHAAAEQEVRGNKALLRLLEEQSRREGRPEASVLPYGLYELGRIYLGLAEQAGNDQETLLFNTVRALKQFYRILKEYPTHPMRVKAGAELLVCKSRLEHLLDAEAPLPDIVVPRQSNNLDELTPLSVNRMLSNKKYDAALPLLQELTEKNRDDVRLAGTLLKLALSQAHLGRGDKALATVAEMSTRYKDAAQTSEAPAVCGRILWEKGQKEAALKMFEMLLENTPQHPLSGPLALLAVREYLKGDVERINKALDICDKLIEQSKDVAVVKQAAYLESETFLKQGRYADAAVGFRKAAELETQNIRQKNEARYMAAYCLFKADSSPENAKQAAPLLTEALNEKKLDETKRKTRLLLAAVYEKAGDASNAVAQYELYQREYPEDAKLPETYSRLGGLYYKLKEKQKSAAALKQLISRYPTSEAARNAYFDLGKMLYEAGDYDEAIKQFERLIAGTSPVPLAHLLWINGNLHDSGGDSAQGAATALAAGNRLLACLNAVNPPDDALLADMKNSPATRNEILFNTAKAAFVAGKHQTALTLFDRLLQSTEIPSFYEAKTLRAKTYIVLKKPEFGRRDLAEAAMVALQENKMDEYARLQCMIVDTYIAEGDFRKPYAVLKILNSPGTPEPWREYAMFKVAVCAKMLKQDRDYAALKDKYLEQFPQGKFVKELD